ncbi:MAG: hypothetical protein ABSE76_01475 [Minisyncoccia bacterium]|jgi:hypothetical protein
MKEPPLKFYWSATSSSGGTLSMDLSYEGGLTKKQKEALLAEGLKEIYKHMEHQGYIPFNARLMSSRDIAATYGNSRQYWEKLLNEGKILYKETSAGRITTDLWVKGYLGNRDEINGYVLNVRSVFKTIEESGKKSGRVMCPVCKAEKFEYFVNYSHTNGICRACGFRVHSTR